MKKIIFIMSLISAIFAYADNRDSDIIDSNSIDNISKMATTSTHFTQNRNSGFNLALGAGFTGYTGDYDMDLGAAAKAGINNIYIGLGYDYRANNYLNIGFETRIQEISADISGKGPYNHFEVGVSPCY